MKGLLFKNIPERFQAIKQKVAGLSRRKVDEAAFRLDPDVIRRWRWVADGARSYFSGEVRGFEHVPEDGPFLIVGNHSGGLLMPDAYVFLSAWWTERFSQALYSLGHDLLFTIPFFGELARAAGVLPGRMDYAEAALERDAAVLVYPGGDSEVFRPTSQRNRIVFEGRYGFVRLALKKQVPIVPVVGYGAHDVNYFLTRGEGLAKMLGLNQVRVNILPFVIAPPWGLVPGFVPAIPLPAKITLEFLAPISWPELGPDAVRDKQQVRDCQAQVVEVMQGKLDQLAAERPNPFSRA